MISDLWSSFPTHCNLICIAFQCTQVKANSYLTSQHHLHVAKPFFFRLRIPEGQHCFKIVSRLSGTMIDVLVSFLTV